MLRIGSYILLFYLAFRLSKHSFEFEKVSRLELVVLPLYSTLMFFITMAWKEEDIIVAIVLLLLSFLIGWLQSSKVEFKDEGKKDKYERPIILMKKNWTYIIGWIILFLVIIGAHFYANSHLELEEVVTEFWKEMVKEILIFARFNANNGWETWLITGVSSLTFTCFIKSKNKKLVETLARRRQNSSFNK